MARIQVLMVCLGNICRSPLAEGILRHKSSGNLVIDSAGTAGYHIGEAPDPRSVDIARKYGIDIRSQRGRQFTIDDFSRFDLIYAMDRSNYEHILAMAPDQSSRDKVQMILNELYPGENMDVPDPYYGGDEGFENVFRMLDLACDRILKKVL